MALKQRFPHRLRHASADAAQACRVSTASGAGTQRASLLPGTTVCTDLACAPVLAGSHHSAPLPAGVGNNLATIPLLASFTSRAASMHEQEFLH